MVYWNHEWLIQCELASIRSCRKNALLLFYLRKETQLFPKRVVSLQFVPTNLYTKYQLYAVYLKIIKFF